MASLEQSYRERLAADPGDTYARQRLDEIEARGRVRLGPIITLGRRGECWWAFWPNGRREHTGIWSEVTPEGAISQYRKHVPIGWELVADPMQRGEMR